MLYKKLFTEVKKLIPKISDTEMIALQSGTTSIDKDIFLGNVEYPKKVETVKKFPDENIHKLLNKYGNIQKIYPSNSYKEIFDYIGKNKFLSFIIPDSFGGTKLSVNELSSVLTKIASVSPALGVSIMVPNSLGPAELLENYGTVSQKKYYLPKLANGEFIPCFGLTGPHNGSDATGSIDQGTVMKNDNGEIIIDLTINKRYITLGPIANLIGLAFKLNDPDNILTHGKEGITVALIESDHVGLIQKTHHNPLNAGFPNGTLKGNIKIPIENIIGGEAKSGSGWKMLMECLASGRGVCLPATANASSKVSTLGIIEYSKHRKQFKMPLINMEGVQQKIVNMLYHTWCIQTSIELTNNLLDMGEKPAVLSAIMKQQTTDRAREVLNEAMDIHAGSAICLGKNNFLEKFYRAAPIGITVEGSNTLTRNLIIFGQGLNKSHPYIYPVLDSILNDDVNKFKNNFNKIIKHSLDLYVSSLFNRSNGDLLERQTLHFANLSNFIALYGGAIKSKQMLSSDMADIMSNLYLAHSVRWYHENNNTSTVLTKYCIERLCHENQRSFNRVIESNSYLRVFLWFTRQTENEISYENTGQVIDEIKNNKLLMEDLKKNIIIENTPLEDLIKLSELQKANKIEEYNELYDKMIQVEEFDNSICDENPYIPQAI